MTNSFISESIDQELSLEEMEELNGGSFGWGVVVEALVATFIIGAIGAEK